MSTSTGLTIVSVARGLTNASRRSDGLLSSSRRAPRRASSAAVAEPIAPVAPVITTTGCSPAMTSVPLHQARNRKSASRPLIDAHRGECGTPGLPAAERYTRAIAMGVDFVEIDIRRTPDRVFISYHDDHTPSGRAVRDLTYAELENDLGDELLKAGDVLEMVDGRVGLHVDVKEEGYEADVVRYIQAGCTHREDVFAWGDVPIRAIKEQFPKVRTGLSLGDDLDGAPPWRYLQVRLSEVYPRARLQRSHADFAAVHQRLARIRVLDYCARANIPAWVWTVDAVADIQSFMRDPRVAVLITDRPDIALRIRCA